NNALRSHRFRSVVTCHPLAMHFGGNFTGLDLTPATPKDICIAHRNAFALQVFVDGSFVLQNTLFFRAVTDSHDIDGREIRSSFTPVTMCQNGMASGLRARALLHPFRNPPVKERIELGDPLTRRRGLYVF